MVERQVPVGDEVVRLPGDPSPEPAVAGEPSVGESPGEGRWSERHLPELFARLRDGVAVVDLTGRFLEANPQLVQLLGYSEEELRELTLWDVTPERWQALESWILQNQVLRRGWSDPFEKEYRSKDGVVFPVEVTAYPLDDGAGQITGFWAFVRDISDRRRAEEGVQASEEMFRLLISATSDGILVAHPQSGQFVFGNQASCRLLRSSPGELRSLTLAEIVGPEDRPKLDAAVARLAAEADHALLDLLLRRRDGSTLPVDLSLSLVRLGETPYLLVSLRDTTERRKLALETQRAERLDAIGLLAGGIAHDFNNILMAILGRISLARLQADPAGSLAVLLGEAEQATFRARDLTQQLLTFASGGAPVRRPVAVDTLLRAELPVDRPGPGLQWRLLLPPGLWTVDVDQAQIAQVLRNLVQHVRQEAAGAGELVVAAANFECGPDAGLSLAPGRYVRVSFTDHGPGFSAERLARLFDPYYATQESGPGLGLAVAFSVLKKHDGLLHVESTPGVGSTFHLYLPAVVREVRGADRPVAGSPSGPRRVLLMDDDADVRKVASQLLVALGYEVLAAAEGEEALRRHQEARAEGRPCDVAILDLTVPGGLGGLGCARRLQEVDPSLPILVASGYSAAAVMAEPLSHGLAAVLMKPYRLAELRQVLQDVLGRPRAPAHPPAG
jgi:PAS domain S-box-containing protein